MDELTKKRLVEDPILSVEGYMERMREPKSSQVVRLNQEHFINIEILRALNSNAFMIPDTSNIVAVALAKYVADCRKLNPEKLAVVEKAVAAKLGKSSIFTK